MSATSRPTSERSITLVLGAGGPSGGDFIRGALHELRELTGFVPERAGAIVGTSAGAFVAAATGAEHPIGDERHRGGLEPLANASDWSPRRSDRLISGARRRAARLVSAAARRRSRAVNYRVAPGPYHGGAVVVTVNATTGRREVHRLATSPEPIQAVRASAAVPFAAGPVRLEGEPHFDGALHSATNADLVEPGAGDLVIVICAMVPRSSGSLLARLDRAALRDELRPRTTNGRSVIVVAPTARERAQRMDRTAFAAAGRRAVRELNGS